VPGLPPNFTLPDTFSAGQTARAADVLGNDQAIRDVLNLPAFGTGALGARPNANTVKTGYVYFATDDWGGTAYVSNGATWTRVASRDRVVKVLTNDAGPGGLHTFSGLDGNADVAYELVWAFHSAAPGGPLWLRFNDDVANSYTPDVVPTGAEHAMLLSALGGAARQTGRALIQAKADAVHRHVLIESATRSDAAVESTDVASGSWSNTADKITKIAVSNQFNPVTGIIVLRRLV
jgi:hypothetical protein